MSNTIEYELSSINKTQITAAARKALIAADSHYHAWPAQQQENFRATMDEGARNRVERVLLKSLLNIQCSIDEVDKIWSDVPLSELNILNWASLLTKGIGEDFIVLNEMLVDDKSLLDFTTLYDYNYDDYLFQEQANKKDFPDYEGTDYYAYKHPSWIRLLIDDNFYYATFTSVATQLCDDIEEAGREYIDQLIPHELVEGKDHGKQEKGGMRWNMKEDANGLEGQLKELKHRWYPYLQERWLGISKANSILDPAVYAQDHHWDNDPHRSFIFTNEETLKKIRWRYFLSDCTSVMADYAVVEKQLEQEVSDAKSFLDKHYQDILENFDPNVVKLSKRSKVLMSAGALDDLEKLSHDDDSTE
jgi:hypothetical protein